ncbi:HAD family hydrolase [Streptomyces durmitorensis]|nr:HAD-IB family phosphatase [Streptomyces durmitorensis]
MKLAVLDMDGTLFNGFLAADMAKALARTAECDTASAEVALDAIHRYQAGVISHDECASDFYEAYGQAVTGLRAVTLDELAHRVWKKSRLHVFGHAKPLVTWLQAQQMTVCLLSGSPDNVLRPAARQLGIKRYWGMTLAQAGGHLTGRVERAPALRGAKSKILEHITRTTSVDWASSFAMGDSSSDIDVLDKVGRAVAFEPDGELRQTAEKRGWTVADRHDVLHRCRLQWQSRV